MKRHHDGKDKRNKPAGYSCNGRIWIENNGETFLGFGRVVLLQRIHELGSLTQAARSMEMSYKHAWDLLNSMNRQAGQPLVITCRGGKGGGGAHLTPAGQMAIKEFSLLSDRLNAFLKQETEKLAVTLLSERQGL